MSVLEWLDQQDQGFSELGDDERQAIIDFSLLWSFFEAKALNTNGNAATIIKTAQSWNANGLLDAEPFDNEAAYFRGRYCQDGNVTDHFRHLHLRAADREELVLSFLHDQTEHPWEITAAVLIIVYRYRNNLFHGTKWAYGIQGQIGNFTHANNALKQAIMLNRAILQAA